MPEAITDSFSLFTSRPCPAAGHIAQRFIKIEKCRFFLRFIRSASLIDSCQKIARNKTLSRLGHFCHTVAITVFSTRRKFLAQPSSQKYSPNSAESLIQTYSEYLMFVWKCQAILGITLVLLWPNFLSLCIPQNR